MVTQLLWRLRKARLLLCASSTSVVRLLLHRSLAVGFTNWQRSISTGSNDDVHSGNRRVFSGIQPTGTPHLGNYCGAIAKWVALQQPSIAAPMTLSSKGDGHSANDALTSPVATDDAPSTSATRLYSVVDMHALTVDFDAKKLPNDVHCMVASLLGAGLDPSCNILFRQSDVAAHAELAWLLSCITPLGWLQRMTQFKEKTASGKTEGSLGLLAYSVLMAADILLYRATHVPVGDDQQQHLELTRMIVARFNNRFGFGRTGGREVLSKPSRVRERSIATLTGICKKPLTRIMSLRDPTKKMSKSDKSAMGRIELTDTADAIRNKVRRATTDAVNGIYYDRKERPGVSNLLYILSAVTDQSIAQLETQCADYSTGTFKDTVADAVIAKICPIGERIKQYNADQEYITQVLANGAIQASELAAVTMKDMKEVMGLGRL